MVGTTVRSHASRALLVLAAALPLPAQRPPNVVLIMVDDLGPEWIGCYGGVSPTHTPVLDRLAAGGMRFRNAWSMPKCTPTRATLLTGQYPFRHGWVNHWDVPRWGAGCHFDPAHNTTFARPLRDAGYATAIAGKWQINDFRVQPDVLDAHGFDEWCMWTGYETGNPPSGERYANPYLHTRAGSETHEGAFGPDVFTDFLIDFARRHRKEPMLLYYPMVLTHTPFTATPVEPDVTGKQERHAAMVRYVDRCVGRLVEAIDTLGLREDTIVFFCGDNGTTRGIQAITARGVVRGGKGKLAETGVHTPLIVNGPGRVPAGVVTDALTDSTDFLPTFVSLAGARLPKDTVVDGRDLAPLLRGEAREGPRSWALTMGGGVAVQREGRVRPARVWADRAVRGPRFKLWARDREPTQLFDLAADPGETVDLSGSERPDVVAAKARLAAVIAATPPTDAAPRYDPTPAQTWDREPQVGVAAKPVPSARGARPNVILVMADDLGWGDLGHRGHPTLRTPELDAMAAAGLRFERFYAAAPVCSPTRGSCLTGRHPFRYGITSANRGHLPAEEWTLAELLGDAGYRTGHFGKWHLGTLTKTVADSNRGGPRGAQHYAPPWEHGFDVCFSTEAKVPTYDPMVKPGTDQPYGTAYWQHDGTAVTDNLSGDDSRIIMDRAIPFVRAAANAKTPFFAVIWFHAPHLPVVAGDRDRAPYAEVPTREQHYYGCVSALDRQVGRLRRELRALGIADDTMLWFCSDNGPEGNASAPGSTGPLRGRKRSLLEGGVRVPGVLEWPARVESGVTDVAACTSDYLPTVLDALGLKMPDARPLDGISLLPLLIGEMRERPRPIAFEHGNALAMIGQRYKIVRARPARGAARVMELSVNQFALFELGEDPGEARDLSRERGDVRRKLFGKLEDWRLSCARSRGGEDY